MGNTSEKQQIYGAVPSLYISRMVSLVNKKGKQKRSLVFDNFPTLFFRVVRSFLCLNIFLADQFCLA
jgi:hypothetical protein